MTTPLRVTHFGNAPGDRGGIASVIRRHLESPPPGVEARAVATYASQDRTLTVRRYLRALAVVARGTRSTGVAHVHLSRRGSFVREGSVLALASLRGVPVVATVHGSDFVAWSSRHPRLTRAVLRRADATTVLSAEAAAHLAALGVRRVHLVPNAVAVPPDPAPPASRPVVLFAGEVSRRKGVDVLLAAWPAVRERRPDAELWLAGPAADVAVPDRPCRTDGTDGSGRTDGTDGVRRLGERPPDEVGELLRSAGVAVLPSRAEGMPMFLLEAMALGRPVVATDVGGVAALVGGPLDPPAAGRLVRPDDPAALAQALVRTLADAGAGTAAHARARQRFDRAVVDARLVDLWRAAASR